MQITWFGVRAAIGYQSPPSQLQAVLSQSNLPSSQKPSPSHKEGQLQIPPGGAGGEALDDVQ